MRNVDGIFPQSVIQAISLRHGSILIEQKRKRDGMLLQKPFRLPHASSFLGGDVRQLRPRLLNVCDHWLKLGHTFHAVRSPGSAQEFENQRAMAQQLAKRKTPLAI